MSLHGPCKTKTKTLYTWTSLVPRPSTPPVFDRLQYAKNGGRRPGKFHHVIRGTADVTDSRRNSLFTFVFTVTEKLENRNKFQRIGTSYL